MTTFIDTIHSLSLSDKRALSNTIKQLIKEEVQFQKAVKLNAKAAKENAKKNRVQEQIKAAQEKLAKLQAKLAA